jgi:hypothetical protein
MNHCRFNDVLGPVTSEYDIYLKLTLSLFYSRGDILRPKYKFQKDSGLVLFEMNCP